MSLTSAQNQGANAKIDFPSPLLLCISCIFNASRDGKGIGKACSVINMTDDVVSLIPVLSSRIVSMFVAWCDNLISGFCCGAIVLLNHVCQIDCYLMLTQKVTNQTKPRIHWHKNLYIYQPASVDILVNRGTVFFLIKIQCDHCVFLYVLTFVDESVTLTIMCCAQCRVTIRPSLTGTVQILSTIKHPGGYLLKH